MSLQRWRIDSIFSCESFFCRFEAFPERQCGRSDQRFPSFYFQVLAGLIDSWPQVRGRPPIKHDFTHYCGLQSPSGFKLHPANDWMSFSYSWRRWWRGVCAVCIQPWWEDNGKAKSIITSLHAALHLSPPPEPSGKDGADAVVLTLWIWTRFDLWRLREFQKISNVFIASGTVSTTAASLNGTVSSI